ncbi:MAG: S9 family peptidase [Anaerolineales bacterium]|nr:S9 family peptidase [Anaerolineales bacterium]
MPQETYLKQLMTLPTVLSALVSPDGRWVAFMWYRVHENIDVFLAPGGSRSPGGLSAPGGSSVAPLALTHTPEATELVSWTADSSAVIVAEDHDSNERFRLYRIDLGLDENGLPHPGPMQPLTENDPPYFLRGGQLSPDGATLYYGANYDFDNQKVIEPTWVYRHDLRTGARIPIARPQHPIYTTPELNLAGTHLIYGRKEHHPAGRQYGLVDVLGKQDREILNFGDEVKVFARWFPDSQHLLVISEATERTPESGQEHISLGIYHCPSGSLHWLVDDPQRSIEGAWVSPDGTIVVDEIRQTNHVPTQIAPPPGGWRPGSYHLAVETPFPAAEGNLLPLGCLADGDWAAMYFSSTSPTDLLRLTQDGRMESLTHVWERTALKPEQLTVAENFTWASVDGLKIQGWLYRAHPNPGRAVIFIHGGPSAHSPNRLHAQIQYLVSAGFNVLDVNYRGSTGFGLKFRELIKEDGWGGREQADIASGAQALIQAGLAAPGKVGVTGTSYGGYSSWYLITHYPPEVIGASAPICGMTDLVVDYNTTRSDLRPLSEEMMGGRPEQAPERYFQRSPINFVQDIRGKLLIVQGAQDPNVTPENVRQVVEHLQAHNIPYELLVFEDEGHGILKPANQEQLYLRLAAFFGAAL